MTDLVETGFDRRRATSEASPDEEPSCRIVRAGEEFNGKQGHLLAPGISAQSAGACRLNLQIARLRPGMRSKAHKHAEHETAIYVLSGKSGV
jgi:uncharacterized RmlC-like cupin family protein